MLRSCFPIVLALVVQAPSLGAQLETRVDTAQIDSLGASLNAEWQRLAQLSFQTPISDVARTLIGFYHNSAREGMAINERLRFLVTLRAESPDNPSLTAKLLREAASLNRESVTLRNVIHDQVPGSVIDQLLGVLVAKTAAVEGTIDTRAPN